MTQKDSGMYSFYQCSRNWCNFQSAPYFRYTVYCHSNFEEKKHEIEIRNSSTKKLCISFFVLDWSLLKMSLWKIGIMIHVKAFFPPAGLQKFSMNESITESNKFLGKRKSFIRSQSLKLKWRKFMFQTISDHFR